MTITMTKTNWNLAPLALLACLVLADAAGATPTTMTYVGVLEDNGAPVNDTLDAVFRIFAAPSGGTSLYEEQSTNLIVIGGVFVVELGQNALDDALLERPELWLEVEIDGEVMTPRVRLTSVPYALRAALAEVAQLAEETLTFGGLAPLDYVTQQQLQTLGLHQGINAGAGLTKTNGTLALASGGVALANLAGNSVDGTKIVDGAVALADLAANSVNATKIVDLSVATVDLADNAVTSAKIAADSIVAADIATGAVGAAEITTDGVTTSEIADFTITSADIDGGVVRVMFLAQGCGGLGALTTGGQCNTLMCNVVSGAPRFLSCDGTCNQTSSQLCTGLLTAGFMFTSILP